MRYAADKWEWAGRVNGAGRVDGQGEWRRHRGMNDKVRKDSVKTLKSRQRN